AMTTRPSNPSTSGRPWKAVVALGLGSLAVVLLLRYGRDLARELRDRTPGSFAIGAESAAAASGPVESSGEPFRLEPVATGLSRPLFITHSGDASGRLFIVEQGGRIRLMRDGKLLSEPFLDLTRKLDSSGGERGLLGLAFAPDYATTRRFWVAHTAKSSSGPVVRIARYRTSADDPDRADPDSESIVLDMADPAGNHNGGMLAFGPDGRLWTGTGDGGNGGDPWDNARNPSSLLGKMLRLDVSRDSADASGTATVDIWALGLRNPWRFSFDRQTGEIWIGDVGQSAWEEIDVADSRRQAPLHFGWRTMEGFHCYDPRKGCDSKGLELPLYEYGHDAGCSVTGGYVYRGKAIPALAGKYLFSDYCTGTVWSLARDPSGKASVNALLQSEVQVSSFGEDEAGEIYLCDHGGGRVLQLEAKAR
ncbi:MAG: PQQ-dependent sugar dehydrogenase, partial [Thermoanaerobaculia bacterium]